MAGKEKTCPAVLVFHNMGSGGVMQYNAAVMIAKDLLEILVCPACKQPLEYRESPESLKCRQCRRVYPVKGDIPIMLIDEATIEAA
jgi:uncharacterized protein YbaR (Trm112 family)